MKNLPFCQSQSFTFTQEYSKMSFRAKSYYEQVYMITEQIPEGRVSTYGAIADYLALGSARMVGYALGQSNKMNMPVPAHRVVNRNGELTGRGHFKPPSMMQKLLEQEGVKVEKDKVVNFKELYWHPQELDV